MLLKINLKLGGTNCIAKKELGGLALLREKPTIGTQTEIEAPVASLL